MWIIFYNNIISSHHFIASNPLIKLLGIGRTERRYINYACESLSRCDPTRWAKNATDDVIIVRSAADADRHYQDHARFVTSSELSRRDEQISWSIAASWRHHDVMTRHQDVCKSALELSRWQLHAVSFQVLLGVILSLYLHHCRFLKINGFRKLSRCLPGLRSTTFTFF